MQQVNRSQMSETIVGERAQLARLQEERNRVCRCQIAYAIACLGVLLSFILLIALSDRERPHDIFGAIFLFGVFLFGINSLRATEGRLRSQGAGSRLRFG